MFPGSPFRYMTAKEREAALQQQQREDERAMRLWGCLMLIGAAGSALIIGVIVWAVIRVVVHFT